MVQQLIQRHMESGRWVSERLGVGILTESLPLLSDFWRPFCIDTVFSDFFLFSLCFEQSFPSLCLANSATSPGQTSLSDWWLYRVGGQSSLSVKIPFIPIIQYHITGRMKRLPLSLSKKSILLTLFLVTQCPGLREALPDCFISWSSSKWQRRVPGPGSSLRSLVDVRWVSTSQSTLPYPQHVPQCWEKMFTL